MDAGSIGGGTQPDAALPERIDSVRRSGWVLRSAQVADVEMIAELRAVVMRADPIDVFMVRAAGGAPFRKPDRRQRRPALPHAAQLPPRSTQAHPTPPHLSCPTEPFENRSW
ncbi:hypothetical protein ABR737_14735 [Streptomyces sp. Edi2]|uniref:hypothetical protein n=1 Tax=Streptomyces sp. Edi2 TaxID=3162528 RepID=UPI003305AD28